jgi:hypothetical protein
MRLVLSWFLGFLTLLLMYFLIELLRNALGLVSYVDYGETIIISHRYYDEEVDGHFTGIGWFFNYIAWLVAIRVGMGIHDGEIINNVSRKNNLIILIVGSGLLIYGISNQIIYFVLKFSPGYLTSAIDGVILLAIGYVCYQYIQKIES